MIDHRAKDILTEVLNVGMGEAAEALSELVGSEVLLGVPEVRTLAMSEVSTFLEHETADWGVFIAQSFTGDVQGRAVLVYSEPCACDLVSTLLPDEPRTATLDDLARSTLQEVGNIILASCVAVFADVVGAKLEFTIPAVALDLSRDYFTRLVGDVASEQVAILVRSELEVGARRVRGTIVLLLRFADLELVVCRTAERWAR